MLKAFPDDAGKALWVRETIPATASPADVLQAAYTSGYVPRTHAVRLESSVVSNGYVWHTFKVTKNA